MSYISSGHLAERLGDSLYARLTDRASGQEANDSIADVIIYNAQAEADGILAKRFATPLDLDQHPELAPLLIARVLDLAEYEAWRSSPFINSVPPRVLESRNAAMEWLQQVVRRELDLPAADLPDSLTAPDDTARTSSTPRTLTAEELEGW